MLNKFSRVVVNKVYDLNNMNDKNKREITAYGFEIILSTFLSIVAIIIYASIIGIMTETIIFLLFFMPLRTYSGGYHADTHFTCFLILFVCINFLCYILNLIPVNLFIISSWILLVYGSIIIEVFSPIVDKNRPMSKRQIKHSKKLTRILLCIFLALCIIFSYTHSIVMLFTAAYAIFITAMSMLAANIKQNIIRRCGHEK